MKTVTSINDLKDLQGQEIGVSDWIVIDQKLIDAFAEVTGDHFWTHTDPERCREQSPFHQTIAHGALSISLISQLVGHVIAFSKEMPITFAYGFNKIRFPAPALSGARYRLRLGLIRIERILGGAQAYWNITIEAEGAAKPCLAAEWITRTYFHLRMGS